MSMFELFKSCFMGYKNMMWEDDPRGMPWQICHNNPEVLVLPDTHEDAIRSDCIPKSDRLEQDSQRLEYPHLCKPIKRKEGDKSRYRHAGLSSGMKGSGGSKLPAGMLILSISTPAK